MEGPVALGAIRGQKYQNTKKTRMRGGVQGGLGVSGGGSRGFGRKNE